MTKLRYLLPLLQALLLLLPHSSRAFVVGPRRAQQQQRHERQIRMSTAVAAPTAANSDLGESSSESSSSSSSFRARPAVHVINSPDDLNRVLRKKGDHHRLTVIKFHAAWCKSCQRFGMLFDSKIARNHGDLVDPVTGRVVRPGEVQFASIEWGKNTELCRYLGIKKLPTVFIYHQDQKLTGFACGPRKIDLLKNNVTDYLAMSNEELEMLALQERGDSLLQDIANTAEAADPANAAAVTGDDKKLSKRTGDWWDWQL